MMINFFKYQGAGNDFVIIDDRNNEFDKSNVKLINFLCDRRFGIGGDGLMLLRNKQGFDFEMVYFNSDGNEGSLCGNGGRCIVAFAYHQRIIGEKCSFLAVDGPHEAEVIDRKGEEWISLKMADINEVENEEGYSFLDTGSPHYVVFKNDLQSLEINKAAHLIRYNERFSEVGTNVNFIEMENEILNIRTYERGVEGETLACGTGVTAAVIAANLNGKISNDYCDVKAQGGELKVLFKENDGTYSDIWLQGPAQYVFKGEIDAGV